jgi:hypothetical protein
MTWAVTIDVPAPVEFYDAVHTALLERAGSSVDGLLVHLARATADGFQVIEVWESRADYDRYVDELLMPVLGELSGGSASRESGQTETPFEVRGLVLPRAGIVV